ncbi:putative PurR-regulated permease PerM [Bradyrhizobium japonicum]|uniref:AI-2E family transporter n=2 Tax=Bradyrhizobium barranii subsp. barranii TaxID=2823807 RepID=A0A9X9Y1G1_9BRAD|nr:MULTISPECIES: AI-2E family transporter [Bradyrhizobium]MDI2074974.1 AI-2E family transporter [Bradyrhizobium sp. Mp27]UEM13755.1 AI-2E family transporter [Bradyrhizobium barranii subsp. barranii]
MLSGPKSPDRAPASVPLAVAIVLGVVISAVMAAPFLGALVWSTTIAVLFTPFDRTVSSCVKSRNLSALITVIVTAFIVVVPAILVAGTLLNEAVRSGAIVVPMFDVDDWTRLMDEHRWLAPALQWVHDKVDFPDLMRTATSALATWSGSVLRASFSGMANFLLTFYFLFYLLRDREAIAEAARLHLPLSEPEFALIAGRFADTIFATVFGTVAVAALQGGLGGLMFWWLGLPAPVFWGVLMALLAIVPFLGAFVIWAPAAVYLALSGAYTSAIILAVWGTFVVGFIDNIVYPILVGSRLRMDTMLSFIAVVGGLVFMGTPGVVLGPLLLALTLTLLQIRRDRAATAMGVTP